MLGEVIVVALTVVVLARILKPTPPPPPPKPMEIHECSMQGHDYQPVYDEQGDEGKRVAIDLPKAGPFMSEHSIVKLAQAAATAAGNVPRKRTYVHSVCRYCGITVERPPGK